MRRHPVRAAVNSGGCSNKSASTTTSSAPARAAMPRGKRSAATASSLRSVPTTIFLIVFLRMWDSSDQRRLCGGLIDCRNGGEVYHLTAAPAAVEMDCLSGQELNMSMTISFPGGVAVDATLNGHTVHTDQPAPLGKRDGDVAFRSVPRVDRSVHGFLRAPFLSGARPVAR